MTFTTSGQFLLVFGRKTLRADILVVSPQRVKHCVQIDHLVAEPHHINLS